MTGVTEHEWAIAEPSPARRRPALWMLFTTVVLAVAGGALALFGVGSLALSYQVKIYASNTMSPTLANPTTLVSAPVDGPLHRGDIVLVDARLFGHTDREGLTVLRVIGLGGDHLVCCDAQDSIQVNGKSVKEDYLTRPPAGSPEWRQLTFDVQVPAGDVFLAADYRDNSLDSRLNTMSPAQGAIPEQDINSLVVGTGNQFLPTRLTPTTSFTQAGLPGAPTSDTGGYSRSRTFALVGFPLLALGIVGTVVVSVLRYRRRAKWA
jgi:signal peptidase I